MTSEISLATLDQHIKSIHLNDSSDEDLLLVLTIFRQHLKKQLEGSAWTVNALAGCKAAYRSAKLLLQDLRRDQVYRMHGWHEDAEPKNPSQRQAALLSKVIAILGAEVQRIEGTLPELKYEFAVERAFYESSLEAGKLA